MSAPLRDPPDQVAVVIAAGGAGTRLGAGPPKALRSLAGEPVLAHAVRCVAAAPSVGCLVVAAPAAELPVFRELVARHTSPSAPEGVAPDPGALTWLVVAGGAERQQSVAAALAAVPARFDIVLVHDAARALTPIRLIEEVAAAVRAGHEAVIPVLPVVDTIVEVDPAGQLTDQPDRAALRAVQTPQGFRRRVLAAAHAAAPDGAATDDAGLVARLGVPVHTIPGSHRALKITTPHDLAVAEALLKLDSVVG